MYGHTGGNGVKRMLNAGEYVTTSTSPPAINRADYSP